MCLAEIFISCNKFLLQALSERKFPKPSSTEVSLVARLEMKNWGSGLIQELKNESEQLQETTPHWLYQTNIAWEIVAPLPQQ